MLILPSVRGLIRDMEECRIDEDHVSELLQLSASGLMTLVDRFEKQVSASVIFDPVATPDARCAAFHKHAGGASSLGLVSLAARFREEEGSLKEGRPSEEEQLQTLRQLSEASLVSLRDFIERS